MKQDIISTKEAAQLLAVGTTTIKRWSDDGTLASVRTVGGHRRFHRDDVLRLLQLVSPVEATKLNVESFDKQHFLQLLLEQGDFFSIQAAVLEARSQLGSWTAVADAIGPVLELIGEAWRRGELSLIAEHLATERLSRALKACAMQIPVRTNAACCVLATAESDLHSVGLSLAELCLREAGWNCAWVGSQTPLAELTSWLAGHDVDMLAISASSWSRDSLDLARQYKNLADSCQQLDIELVLGGQGAWPEPHRFGYRVHTFTQFASLLRQLGYAEVHHEQIEIHCCDPDRTGCAYSDAC